MYSEDLLHWIEEFVFYEIRRITRTANLLLSVRRGCLCSKRCLLWVIQIGFTSHGDRAYTPIGIISISRRWRLFHRKGLSLSPIVGGGDTLVWSLVKVQHFKERFSVVGRGRVTTLLRYFDRLSNRRLSNRAPSITFSSFYLWQIWRIWQMFLEFSRVYAGTFGAAKVPAYTREDFWNHPS